LNTDVSGQPIGHIFKDSSSSRRASQLCKQLCFRYENKL